MIAPRLRIRLPSAPKDGTPSQRQWFAAVTNWINSVVDDAATPVTATQDKVTRRSLQIDMVDNTPDLEKPLSQAAQARFTAIQESLARLTASTSVTVISDWDVAATGATPTTAKSGMYFRATTAGTVGAVPLNIGDVVLFYLDNTGALQWIIVDSPAERAAAYTPADWAATAGVARIENKPTLFGLSSPLTGLAAGTNVAIAATDSLIIALANLQAQASANAELLAPVPQKLLGGWYTSGRWYDTGYPYGFSITTQSVPAGAVRYFAYSPLETVTLQKIATNVATAMPSGGTLKFGIYADSGGFPAAQIYASSAIAANTTGVKSTACTQTLTAGVVYWFAIFVSATAVFSANTVSRTYGSLQAFTLSGLTRTGLSDIPTSGAGAGFTNAGYAPFLSFQVQ